MEGRVKEIFVEKCVLEMSNNPALIKYYASFTGPFNKLYLLVEYCMGGSLESFLQKQKALSIPLARHFCAEIVLALKYLREMKIVHRDLKPGNLVLLKDYHIKMIDFATCKVFNEAIQQKVDRHCKGKP